MMRIRLEYRCAGGATDVERGDRRAHDLLGQLSDAEQITLQMLDQRLLVGGADRQHAVAQLLPQFADNLSVTVVGVCAHAPHSFILVFCTTIT